MTFQWKDYKYGSWLLIQFGKLDAKIDVLGKAHFGAIINTAGGKIIREFLPGQGVGGADFTLDDIKAFCERLFSPPANLPSHNLARRLGKAPHRVDQRTLRLAKYLVTPPAAPESRSFLTKIPDWGMMLNDSLGDCTCAAAGHQMKQWTTYAGTPFTPPDSDILSAYEAVGGYVPGNPATDNGCVVLDVLNYWRKTGIAGHKILGYVAIDTGNIAEIKQALALFGNVYLGVQLPVSVQGQPIWTVPSTGLSGDGAPGSWGGHAIPMVQYDSKGFNVITWGAPLWASWNFFRAYCDEAYAVLSADWIEKSGLSPSQFNLSDLKSDLAQL